jgi:hypothetical protein
MEVEHERPTRAPGIDKLFIACLSVVMALRRAGRGLIQKKAPIIRPNFGRISISSNLSIVFNRVYY